MSVGLIIRERTGIDMRLLILLACITHAAEAARLVVTDPKTQETPQRLSKDDQQHAIFFDAVKGQVERLNQAVVADAAAARATNNKAQQRFQKCEQRQNDRDDSRRSRKANPGASIQKTIKQVEASKVQAQKSLAKLTAALAKTHGKVANLASAYAEKTQNLSVRQNEFKEAIQATQHAAEVTKTSASPLKVSQATQLAVHAARKLEAGKFVAQKLQSTGLSKKQVASLLQGLHEDLKESAAHSAGDINEDAEQRQREQDALDVKINELERNAEAKRVEIGNLTARLANLNTKLVEARKKVQTTTTDLGCHKPQERSTPELHIDLDENIRQSFLNMPKLSPIQEFKKSNQFPDVYDDEPDEEIFARSSRAAGVTQLRSGLIEGDTSKQNLMSFESSPADNYDDFKRVLDDMNAPQPELFTPDMDLYEMKMEYQEQVNDANARLDKEDYWRFIDEMEDSLHDDVPSGRLGLKLLQGAKQLQSPFLYSVLQTSMGLPDGAPMYKYINRIAKGVQLPQKWTAAEEQWCKDHHDIATSKTKVAAKVVYHSEHSLDAVKAHKESLELSLKKADVAMGEEVGQLKTTQETYDAQMALMEEALKKKEDGIRAVRKLSSDLNQADLYGRSVARASKGARSSLRLLIDTMINQKTDIKNAMTKAKTDMSNFFLTSAFYLGNHSYLLEQLDAQAKEAGITHDEKKGEHGDNVSFLQEHQQHLSKIVDLCDPSKHGQKRAEEGKVIDAALRAYVTQ